MREVSKHRPSFPPQSSEIGSPPAVEISPSPPPFLIKAKLGGVIHHKRHTGLANSIALFTHWKNPPQGEFKGDNRPGPQLLRWPRLTVRKKGNDGSKHGVSDAPRNPPAPVTHQPVGLSGKPTTLGKAVGRTGGKPTTL